jgi:GT2 family glycosyltransferase
MAPFHERKRGASMKLSIVTVCYNSAKTIEQTIQSVLQQSNKFEENPCLLDIEANQPYNFYI